MFDTGNMFFEITNNTNTPYRKNLFLSKKLISKHCIRTEYKNDD